MSTPSIHYVPGDSAALVSGERIVLLRAALTDPSVARAYAALDGGGDLNDVLDELLTGGLKALVDFAMLERDGDDLRLLVRGEVPVWLASGGEIERPPHAAWWDTRFPDEQEARLGGAGTGPRLPLRDGVVAAGAVVVNWGGAGDPGRDLESVTGQPSTAAFVVDEEDRPPSSPPPGVPARPALPDLVLAGGTVSAGGQPPTVKDVPPPQPMPMDSGFDHLFEATQLRPAEHPGEREEAGLPPIAPDAVAVYPNATETLPSPLTLEVSALAPDPVPLAAAGLITGMPWGASDPGVAIPGVDGSPAVPAAGWQPPASPATHPEAPEQPTHPGSDVTVNRSSLINGGGPDAVTVVAARCPQGHLSPAYAGRCRVCRVAIPPQQPFEIPRPKLGQLRLSTGGVVPLDRGLILGRNPRIPEGFKGEQPNLVQVADPNKDVSGQHLEVTLDYWNVMVRDLGSTNGTEVVLPGEMPVALRPHDAVIVEPGSRVVLAGSVSFTFEVTE